MESPSAMAEEAEAFVRFQLENGPKSFASLGELEEWIQEESRWWSAIIPKVRSYNRDIPPPAKS